MPNYRKGKKGVIMKQTKTWSDSKNNNSKPDKKEEPDGKCEFC